MEISVQTSPEGRNILLNGKILLRLTPHIIFRENEDGYSGCEAFINEKEKNIYVFQTLGNNTAVYFLRENPAYAGEYLLENIIGIDLVPFVVVEGQVVNTHYGFRDLYVGGPAENGGRQAIIKINPMYPPMIETAAGFKYGDKFGKEEIQERMKHYYPEQFENSSKNLKRIKLF